MYPTLDEIRKTRKKYTVPMLRSGIKTFRAMAEVEEMALEAGALDRKTKELIAMGISMAKNCYG